ncbi:MAG: hypothetical protein OXF54_01810 [Caldilineaceae bacterium]|nr:hypothetical protein [Caldilineaceae bacterium]
MSDESQHKIPYEIQRQIAAAPGDSMYLLLHVNETGPVQFAAIEKAGYEVRHQTSIVPCYAVSGPGQGLRELVKEAWLVRVEEDGAVETM